MIIIFMDLELMNETMEESLWENGKTIKWMDKEFSRGKMGVVIQDNMLMTKNKVSESSHGLTAEDMKGNDIMENKMEKEFISIKIK